MKKMQESTLKQTLTVVIQVHFSVFEASFCHVKFLFH